MAGCWDSHSAKAVVAALGAPMMKKSGLRIVTSQRLPPVQAFGHGFPNLDQAGYR